VIILAAQTLLQCWKQKTQLLKDHRLKNENYVEKSSKEKLEEGGEK
jgi:hypothetical protein